MIPNLFLAGVAKAGTSAIHQYLNDHEEIGMSVVKEPHYFSNVSLISSDSKHATNINNLEEYLSLFPTDREYRFLGESSPSYLWDPDSPQRIFEFNPSSKILLILRDPIDRAFSHYNMDFYAGREEHKSFLQAMKDDYQLKKKGWGLSRLYVELGFYADGIKRFRKYFNQDSMGIFFFEKIFGKGGQGKAGISDFLGLPQPSNLSEKVLNPGTDLTGLGKIIKKSNLTSKIPQQFKDPFKKVFSKTESKPESKAVKYLLEQYRTDVLRMRDELDLPYYYELFKTRYNTDLDTF